VTHIQLISPPSYLPPPLLPADARTYEEMAALRDDALTTINLDIPTTVDRLLSALPGLR
jgi:hypothetical protein